MAKTKKQMSEDISHTRTHETRDASFKNLMLVGAGLFGLLALMLLLTWGLYYLYSEHSPHPGTSASPFTKPSVLPPEPRLQTSPHAELQRLRAAEDSVLQTYGWVNKDSGIVRIPIDRAMDLLVKKSMPVRAQENHNLTR